MPVCASISNRVATFALLIAGLLATSSHSFAVDPPAPAGAPPGATAPGKTDVPEEDDFKQTPYTQYGDFNSDEDEAEDLRFYQYGRFFGLSLGVGYEGATGNKGLLYNGGMPAFELKVHYWFDFNLALTLGIYTANHFFNGKLDAYNDTQVNRYNLSMFKVGADLRYYFDTTNLSAPITFAGPYLTAGFGSYSRTLTDQTAADDPIQETSLGFNFGAGLEFVLKPKKNYFNLEAKFHSVGFEDDQSGVELNGGTRLPNQEGMYFSLMGAFLFTW